MTSLHIEHPITDLDTWLAAFTSFDEVRRSAGVVSEQVRHPADDDRFVIVDLEFDTAPHAAAFLQFLHDEIWSSPERAPALDGTPLARILEPVDLGTHR